MTRPGPAPGRVFHVYTAAVLGPSARHTAAAPAGLLVVTTLWLCAAGAAIAQEGDGQEPRPPSHPMLFGLGIGGAGDSEGTVSDLRIPMGYTLISPDDRPWGLRLRLVVYAGLYDLQQFSDPDFVLRFESLAATPGVEFLVPVGGGWTLKPFTEIGYGRDFANRLDFGVWSIGMRTLAEWEMGNLELSFGTQVQFLTSIKSDLNLSDDFWELKLGLDVGIPLGFAIAGNRAYLSPYGIRRQFIDALIARPDGEPLQIEYSNEAGLAFGTRPRTKLWFFTLPRIGLGYRWGPNVKGVRLSFGFPF